MFAKTAVLAGLLAYAEARFGQEQVPIPAISAVQGGSPGQAATIAGAAISDLLGAANACAKLTRADQIVSDLGGGADAISAAIGMVTAEKNTNPFTNNNAQNVCSDPTLPATAELRGITPLIDPAVNGSDAVNALSAQTAKAPLDATGKSVFDLLNDAGFGGSVVAQANNAAGGASASASASGSTATAAAASSSNSNSGSTASAGNATAASAGSASNCSGGTAAAAAVSSSAAAATASSAASSTASSSASSGSSSVQQSTIAGLDFGTCIPTMIFEGGLGGRPATEFTFQLADTVARQGQEEALNPNIITNRICDQLTNVCNANAASKTACTAAKAQISALGTRDKSTADAWNTALGFAGFVTNPDGGPADKPATATAAARVRAVQFRS